MRNLIKTKDEVQEEVGGDFSFCFQKNAKSETQGFSLGKQTVES